MGKQRFKKIGWPTIVASTICSYFLFYDAGISLVLWYAVIFGLELLFIVLNMRRLVIKLNGYNNAFIIMGLVILINYIRPDARHDSSTFAFVSFYFLCILFLLITPRKQEYIAEAARTFRKFAVFLSLLTILFSLSRNLYWNTYGRIVSTTTREYQQSLDAKGYGVALGGVAFSEYMIFFGIVIEVALLLTDGKQKARSWIKLLIHFMAVYLIGRRSELLCALTTIIIVYILTGRGSKSVIRLLTISLLAILVLWLGYYSLPLLASIPSFSRYYTVINGVLSGTEIGKTTVGRTYLWNIALQLYSENKVFGIGWGGFAYHVPESIKVVYGDFIGDVHNIYLQFLCETGIVGTVFILSCMGYCLFKSVNCVKMYNMSKEYIVSLMIQLFFLILGFMDPCFTKVLFLYMYSFALFLVSIKQNYSYISQEV